MKIFFHIFLLTIGTIANGQNPLVKQWDKRYGGIDDEIAGRFRCLKILRVVALFSTKI